MVKNNSDTKNDPDSYYDSNAKNYPKNSVKNDSNTNNYRNNYSKISLAYSYITDRKNIFCNNSKKNNSNNNNCGTFGNNNIEYNNKV